jgi:hypothetical protein
MTPPEAEFGGLPARPSCTFCSGDETELMNAFGSHASVATYWCRRCRSPFELLKWGVGAPPHPDDVGAGDDPSTGRNGT